MFPQEQNQRTSDQRFTNLGIGASYKVMRIYFIEHCLLIPLIQFAGAC
jgi:hypothetical protein